MIKKALSLILLGALVSPALALADCSGGVTIGCMISAAVNTTWNIAAGITIILWVITGIMFLAAQGAPDKVNSAKKALFAALIGTVVIILAFSAIYIIGNAVGVS
jgi:hypothetical protein